VWHRRKRKAAHAGPPLVKEFPESYFGAGVVVLPELFLDFFPPFLWLWPLVLVDVAGLPVAGLSVDPVVPPVACATDSVAPSSMANAMVSSFFIQSPSMGNQVLKSIDILGEYWCQYCTEKRKKRKRPVEGRFSNTAKTLFRGGGAGIATLLGRCFFAALVVMALLGLGALFPGSGGASLGLVAAGGLTASAAACLSKCQRTAENQRAHDCE